MPASLPTLAVEELTVSQRLELIGMLWDSIDEPTTQLSPIGMDQKSPVV